MIHKIKKRLFYYANRFKTAPLQALLDTSIALACIALPCLFISLLIEMLGEIAPVLGCICILLYICTPFWEKLAHAISRGKTPPVQYPVYLGIDGSRVLPQEITRIFEGVCRRFQVCYFALCNDTGNRLEYVFPCIPRPDTAVDYDFILLLQKEVESILSPLFLEKELSTALLPDIVAVDIRNGKLLISLAKNDAGIRETSELQERIRKTYLRRDLPITSEKKDFEESWDENTPNH